MTSTEHPQTSTRFQRYVATRVDIALMGAILGVVGLGLAIRPRAQRYAARATEQNPWIIRLAVVIAVLPGIPTAVVYAAAGWARMRLATFLLLDLLGAV